jgi:hypothetical protein
MLLRIHGKRRRNGAEFLGVGLEDYIIKGRNMLYPMDGKSRYYYL